MQNKKLEKNKLKLTIFFSILVFLLAIFLESIFFGFKYFNEANNDKNIFLKQTELIYEKIDKQKDILDLFWDTFLWDNLWEFNKKRFQNVEINLWRKVNFFILDKNNEIVDKRILENASFDIFSELDNKSFYNKNSTFILSKNLENHILGDRIIFYQKYSYSIYSMLEDFLLFVFITFLSTIIFYIIWKKFVNKNLKPVEKNLLEMEEFIQNAWHELKTPISIIHSNLQLIKNISKEKDIIDLSKEWIIELERFNDLIDWLTELSWISLDLEKEEVKLKKEIPEIVSEYRNKLRNKKIKIKYKFNDNIKIFTSKQHFIILFSNLLNNAIKYNKVWWEIKIVLNKNKLTITDSWIWISKKNLNKIFDRFYQEDNSQTWDWFWIWLSLVSKIISINKWKISASSQKWEFTKFEIKF